MTEAEQNRLVVANMGLVKIVAGDFRGRGVDFEELSAIGALGLVIAARTFDPSKGSFGDWASTKIKSKIQDAIKSGNYELLTSEEFEPDNYEWDALGFTIYERWPENFSGNPETLALLFDDIRDKQAKFEQAFMSLTPTQRKLIMLVYLRDPPLSIPEAAREMRISYLKSWRSIKTGLYRMRKVIGSMEANQAIAA